MNFIYWNESSWKQKCLKWFVTCHQAFITNINMDWTTFPNNRPKRPTWTFQSAIDDLRDLAPVYVSSFDFIQSDIGPEHEHLLLMDIQCNGILETLDEGGVLWPIRNYFTDIDTIRKYKIWFPAWKIQEIW